MASFILPFGNCKSPIYQYSIGCEAGSFKIPDLEVTPQPWSLLAAAGEHTYGPLEVGYNEEGQSFPVSALWATALAPLPMGS